MEEKLNFLIVEDNPIIQKIHAILLQNLGCQVSVAANGKIALELHQNYIYDAILLDIGLPDIDGIEVTKIIRLRESGKKKTLIIVVTAHTGCDIKEKCLKNGADHVMHKPIGKENLKPLLSQAYLEKIDVQIL